MKYQYNLLAEELLPVNCKDGKQRSLSLPSVLDLLSRDEISSFIGLRPHQWQSWHCFLVQCATLALLNVGKKNLPASEEDWRQALRGLTAEFTNDEPWCLVVADQAEPAFMQPPIPTGCSKAYKSAVSTPDELDMLVTSKNHDVKQHCALTPAIDHWIYALINLQTMEGFLGAGNYGASRMNGGFSNRCFMGLTTHGGMGTHVMRDIQMLLDNYDGLAKLHEPTFGKNSSEGTSLVWLVPWDGTGPLPMHTLHPLYIEICRRIRFSADDLSGIKVVAAGSKKERIDAKALDGNTGDPWAPLVVDKKGKIKSLTVTSSGFGYRMVCRLMFDREGGYLPSMLSRPANTEKNTEIVFSALVRGQGKTEGLRQRRLPISLAARNMMARSDESSMGKVAARRLQVIADIQKHLRRCIALQNASAPSLEGGKLDFNASSDSDRERALVFSEAYDKYIDAIFFEDLWNFASLPAEKADDAENQWRHKITRRAEAFLDEAAGAMPKRGHLHYGTRAKVKSYFIAVALRNGWLIKKNSVDQVA